MQIESHKITKDIDIPYRNLPDIFSKKKPKKLKDTICHVMGLEMDASAVKAFIEERQAYESKS